MRSVTAVIVNYNSGHDCARLIGQLAAQRGVDLKVVVIDSASKDDSLSLARTAASRVALPVRFVEPGRNVGYTGNNLALTDGTEDVFVVNPDVEITDPGLIAGLADLLATHPDLAAVAPHIRTDNGRIEYTDSIVDLPAATFQHAGVGLDTWPHPAEVHRPARLDGAVWLLRRAALAEVGPFDERFFLFHEEVDWCLRARNAGWHVGLSRDLAVTHRRSSSFVGTKGAQYNWRNTYLLCAKHGSGWRWRVVYFRRLVRFTTNLRLLKAGQSWRAVKGVAGALTGQYGPLREDR